MEKAMSFLGIPIFIGICYALSTNRRKVDWRLVLMGLSLQFVFAFIILKTDTGRMFFAYMNDVVSTLLGFTSAGARMVFGNLSGHSIPVGVFDQIGGQTQFVQVVSPEHQGLSIYAQPGAFFAFGVLPTIIFFSSIMTVLYHLGIMQRIVYYVALLMQKTMRTSGAESLSAAANIFVGQTEAPLVIKPYVEKMTMSELHCVMTGGMATIAGGVMAAYVGMLKDQFPDIAGHLMAASVMSAPAALVFAKIMVPEEEVAETAGKIELQIEKIDKNVIDAAARGASEGMSLAINVAAMLIAFIAIVALGNHIWGTLTGAVTWVTGYDLRYISTLQQLLGYIASPLAYIMGIPSQDLTYAGQLIGEKTILNEFVAYSNLGRYINGQVLSPCGAPVVLAQRTVTILTYALCGFANLGSIGILLGGIGGIAPSRRGDLAKLGFKALIAGTFASFLTASIAGVFIG